MIHSIGTPQPDAMVVRNNQNRADARTSYHGMIDGLRDRAIQLLPWNARAWHGGGTSNNTHIAIGMSEPNTIRYTGGANFVDNNPEATGRFVRQTYAKAALLFAHLCTEFNLNPTRDGVVIISHSAGHRIGIASNHGDVEHLWNRFGLTLAQFRLDIQAAMRNVVQPTTGDDIEPRRYLVTAQSLNVRSTPGVTNTNRVGAFPRYREVIATRQQGQWAFATDGALTGWVHSGYLSRIVDAPYYTPEMEEDVEMNRDTFNQWLAEETENRRRALSQLPPSAWAKEVWERLTEQGVTDGTAPLRDMSRQEGLVLIDRMITALNLDPALFEGCLCDHEEPAPTGEPFTEFDDN